MVVDGIHQIRSTHLGQRYKQRLLILFYTLLVFSHFSVANWSKINFFPVFFLFVGQTMLCHHFVSIIALAICLITGSYGTEIVATIFGSEISNPLLQCRWFLKYSGNRDTVIADLVDVAFILTFTYVRIVVGSNLLYCYQLMPHIPIFMRIASVAFYLISWAFWITILKFGYRKCQRKYLNFKNITKIDEVNSGILYQKDHTLLCSKPHQN